MPRKRQERQRFALVLRRRAARVQEFFGRARLQYPRTAEALRLLQEALEAEVVVPAADLAVKREKRRASGATSATEAVATGADRDRKWYFQARRFKKERDALAEKLRLSSGAKEKGGALSEEWLLRVILSKPNASARSVAQSFADIVGSDVRTVSRGSINSVRDAWVEFYKPMVLTVAAGLVANSVRLAAEVRADFAPIYLVQIQDEADIRLRSEHARDGPALPSRSRSSKVQQSVLTIHGAGGQAVDLPLELEALGDKSARTLATSFERVLRSVAASVLPKPQAATPEVWVIHMLIGDGIATNELAGRILWACVHQKQLADGARYFLIVMKCATHQTGLSAKSSVIGRAAAIGAGDGELYKAITGVASRLFKYVICDYFEEFAFSVREWVVQKLIIQSAAADEDTAAIGAAKALQRLYTKHVVPDRMLALWNNGLGDLRHRLEPGLDPDEERPRVVSDFVQWIVKHLLHVDSHPTLSRFFTFRGCVDRMLTMSFIDMPKNAFKVRSIKPRQENSKRLKAVDNFFKHAEAPQTLRRTCLAFQLTGGVEAITSTNPTTGDTPTVVRLLRGEATACLEHRCQDMLACMATCDSSLDLAPAVSTVLGTALDMYVRMRAFVDYPIALGRMSKRWFPGTYLTAVHDFLRTPVEQVDLGVGAQLHALAWKRVSEMAACAWLVSKAVQDLLDGICEVVMASSLPVERRHNEIKKWEASKLTHIASASRNAIVMRFLKWREEQCQTLDAKQKELRRVVRTNLQSLAWKDAPQNRPAGVKRLGSFSSQPPAAEDAAADLAAGVAMSEHVAQNRAALEERKQLMLVEADADLQRLLASFAIPVTRSQWSQWLSGNIGEFRAKMRTATALRRQGNVRVRASPDLPAPARRIQPLLEKRLCDAEWATFLANRTGWWGLTTRDNGVVFVFLLLLRGRTYYLDVNNRAATGVPNCVLDSSFLLETCVQELAQLEVLLADDEVLKVWEFKALAGYLFIVYHFIYLFFYLFSVSF